MPDGAPSPRPPASQPAPDAPAPALAAPAAHDPAVDHLPRRRLSPLLLFFVALAIVGYFVFTAVDGVINNNSLALQIAALNEEIDDLQWDADRLSALVAYLDSDEYIERTAREELGFVRVGEEAFAIEAPLRTGLPITRSPWWSNLLPQTD